MTHCWHLSDFQHAAMNHRDVYCCWCHEARCQSSHEVADLTHGPHAPKLRRFPQDAEQCPARLQGETG